MLEHRYQWIPVRYSLSTGILSTFFKTQNFHLEKASSGSGPTTTTGATGGITTTPPSGQPVRAGGGDEGWNLVHPAGKTTAAEDPLVAALKEERTKLLRKIQDSRRLVKRFVSQLHDTETFIKVQLLQGSVQLLRGTGTVTILQGTVQLLQGTGTVQLLQGTCSLLCEIFSR